jgi:hypothetical protein
MMCVTVENRAVEWRATVAVCQNSRKRWPLGVSIRLFGRFLRDNSLGRLENCCNLNEILTLWGLVCRSGSLNCIGKSRVITVKRKRSKNRMKKPNPIQFYVGLVLALGSAAWTFFGSFHPSHTIILIIGIALIATSKYRLLK